MTNKNGGRYITYERVERMISEVHQRIDELDARHNDVALEHSAQINEIAMNIAVHVKGCDERGKRSEDWQKRTEKDISTIAENVKALRCEKSKLYKSVVITLIGVVFSLISAIWLDHVTDFKSSQTQKAGKP